MVLLIGAAIFAAVAYWWPKVFGFALDERNGLRFFWSFILATAVVFLAMFALGFEGETRRLDYIYDPAWRPMLLTEETGMGIYCLSIFFFIRMIYVSLRDRIPVPADPWATSRTLEFLTASPVPFYNFAVTPQVNARDELAWRRTHGLERAQPEAFEVIHMPSNTGIPFIIGMLSLGFGFGMIWRIWWLAGLSLLGIILAVIIRSFDKNLGYELQPEGSRSSPRVSISPKRRRINGNAHPAQ
jgi:cytochrome o ubiquinol oxidase subunit 1